MNHSTESNRKLGDFKTAVGHENAISSYGFRRAARSTTALVILAILSLLLSACTSNTSTAGGGAKELQVYAAASLKNVFTQLKPIFEQQNPGTTITFNFAGSSELVTQISAGAPATVFAAADTKNMAKLQQANLIQGAPSIFAKNTLQLAVPPSNPAHIAGLTDFAKPGVRRVICAVPVPCGNATAQLARNANLSFTPASEEQSVTDVLNKIIADEADAGIVYVTDIKSAGVKVKGITIPAGINVTNDYPIGIISGSDNQELSQKFIALVLSKNGQQLLRNAGFTSP